MRKFLGEKNAGFKEKNNLPDTQVYVLEKPCLYFKSYRQHIGSPMINATGIIARNCAKDIQIETNGTLEFGSKHSISLSAKAIFEIISPNVYPSRAKRKKNRFQL